MPPPPGEFERLAWAAVADKFNALPAQLGALTDWQIAHVLFHKRDKDGSLTPPGEHKQPDAPASGPTDESRLGQIDFLEAMKVITAENAAQLREQIRNGKPE